MEEENPQQLNTLKKQVEDLTKEINSFKELFYWHKHTGIDKSQRFGYVSKGTGAPTLIAPQGSLYLRTDGSSVSTRAYINTDGGSTWTAITTVA